MAYARVESCLARVLASSSRTFGSHSLRRTVTGPLDNQLSKRQEDANCAEDQERNNLREENELPVWDVFSGPIGPQKSSEKRRSYGKKEPKKDVSRFEKFTEKTPCDEIYWE